MVLLSLALFVMAPPSVAICHVTVIDGLGGRPKKDVTVLITGDRIAKIGKKVSTDGARVIDGTGKFLIPGLWDMHVHGTGLPNFSALYIANGVTGVRDMFGQMVVIKRERQAIQNNEHPGPEIVAAGRILDGPNPYWPGSFVVANATEGKETVDKALAEGSDFIKVYSRLPRDAYFGIVAQAKARRVPFEGHVPESITAFEASEAGQKSIEHLSGFLRSTNRHPELSATIPPSQRTQYELDVDPKREQDLVRLFAKKKTWQCPTLTVLRAMLTPNEEEVRNPEGEKHFPPYLMATWRRPIKQTLPQLEGGRAKLRHLKDIVRMMSKARVPILAGTDVLNPYCMPGFSLHDELGLLVESGLTPMQALQAATLNPAKFLEREKEFGSIRTGLRADMVLLDRNPLENIGNTRSIRSVFLKGQELDRAALDGMLKAAEVPQPR